MHYLDELDFLFTLPIQGREDVQMHKGANPHNMFHVKLKVYIVVPKFQCNFYINVITAM